MLVVKISICHNYVIDKLCIFFFSWLPKHKIFACCATKLTFTAQLISKISFSFSETDIYDASLTVQIRHYLMATYQNMWVSHGWFLNCKNEFVNTWISPPPKKKGEGNVQFLWLAAKLVPKFFGWLVWLVFYGTRSKEDILSQTNI